MKERKGEHPFGDAGQLILLVIFLIVWISDSFFLHWSIFLQKWISDFIRTGFLILCLLVSSMLVKSGHIVISKKERPNYVVDTGAFYYVRHPLYLGAILAYLGMAISSLSLFSLALLIPIFLFYNYIATFEEKVLKNKFGTAYREYKERTGKWFPYLW